MFWTNHQEWTLNWFNCLELSYWAEKGQFCLTRKSTDGFRVSFRAYSLHWSDIFDAANRCLAWELCPSFNILIVFYILCWTGKMMILDWNSVKPLSFEVLFSIKKFWQVMLTWHKYILDMKTKCFDILKTSITLINKYINFEQHIHIRKVINEVHFSLSE